MGYESENPHSHRWISNRSYTLNFKIYNFISWYLYLSPHFLIPPPYTSDSSCSPRCPRAQFPLVPVAPLCHNVGLTRLDIGTKSAGWCDLKGSSLRPLFPPFRSGAGLFPGCGQLLPASLCPVSPKTPYSCDSTDRYDVSVGGGPSDRTTSECQEPAGCAGSGIGWCWRWVSLTLWDSGPGSVSGHLLPLCKF